MEELCPSDRTNISNLGDIPMTDYCQKHSLSDLVAHKCRM